MSNLLRVGKFSIMADLRDFAAELAEGWNEYKMQVLAYDGDNEINTDPDLEYLFFKYELDAAGVTGWQVDYVLYHLGY